MVRKVEVVEHLAQKAHCRQRQEGATVRRCDEIDRAIHLSLHHHTHNAVVRYCILASYVLAGLVVSIGLGTRWTRATGMIY